MSTSAKIGLQRKDGTVKCVWLHFDGYFSHAGRILKNNYDTFEKINELLAHGTISSLGAELGITHDRSSDLKGICTFYHRDRGEDGPKIYDADSPEEFWETDTEEYNYLFVDGIWYATNYEHKTPVALSEVA